MKLKTKLEKAEKHLASLDEREIEHLDFNWEGISFTASTEISNNGKGEIELSATLGQLFYTIEDSAQRAMALERLFQTNRDIDGVYTISPNGTIGYKSKTECQAPISAQNLMEALTVILLEGENHLRSIKAHLKPVN